MRGGGGRSAVGLGATADPKDFDRERGDAEEEDTVVAGAEAEFGAGRLEFDHVAGAGGEVVIDRLENANCRFPAFLDVGALAVRPGRWATR
jgi:hypothetical protein